MLAVKCLPLNSQIPFILTFFCVDKGGGLDENVSIRSYLNNQSSVGGAFQRDNEAVLEEVRPWGPSERVYNLTTLDSSISTSFLWMKMQSLSFL